MADKTQSNPRGAGRKKTHTPLNIKVPLWVDAWLENVKERQGFESKYEAAQSILIQQARNDGADPKALINTINPFKLGESK